MVLKQFEKWWKKERRVDTLAGYRNDEDVWRAALEWVKSRSEISKSLYMINVNDIDEELGEN